MKFILSVERTINLLVLLSLIIIICNDLWWYKLPELFEGGNSVLNSIYNLSMGYLVTEVS